MIAARLKKIFFQSLSLEWYLKVLQKFYWVSYRLGLLKWDERYKYHYFAKKLIREGDVVIDIGANLGYYSKLFSKWVGPTGQVISVEPVPIYNKVFRPFLHDEEQVVLYPYALGKNEKKIKMVSQMKDEYLHTGLVHVFEEEKEGQLKEQDFVFNAEMKNPEKLFKDLDRIDYIKCDVEGFEYEVFGEMKPILEKHHPILQVEVNRHNKAPLMELLEEESYQPYKLEDNTLKTKEDDLDTIAGDYLFISEEDIPRIDEELFA